MSGKCNWTVSQRKRNFYPCGVVTEPDDNFCIYHRNEMAELEKLGRRVDSVPKSESEKFFAHLNNGEVSLKFDVEHGNVQTIKGIRIVVTPKEVGK